MGRRAGVVAREELGQSVPDRSPPSMLWFQPFLWFRRTGTLCTHIP